jgi:chaperonin GroEL
MAKQIVHGEESRQAILRGVNLLADAIGHVGSEGRNVVIEESGPRPSRKTASPSQRIELKDSLENIAPRWSANASKTSDALATEPPPPRSP